MQPNEITVDDEQVQKFINIAQLYTNKGYPRRAAFYMWYACYQTLQRKTIDWNLCYQLLITSLDGYKLTLDPVEYEKRIRERTIGWTGIHIHILVELVRITQQMKCEQLTIRHLSFLLHSLIEYLLPKQRVELARQLEALCLRIGEGGPVAITLDNGLTLPSVNLTKFPLVASFAIQDLFTSLRPLKMKSKKRESLTQSTPNSPFIFTPVQAQRAPRKRGPSIANCDQSVDFKWIEGETCQIAIQVVNILPIELTVNHMSLMTDGVVFETYPTSIILPPESGPFPVSLTGTPRAVGRLEVLGYTCHVLGVKSNCTLSQLPTVRKLSLPKKFIVDVIAQLPLLDVSCPDLPKADTFSTISNEQIAVNSNSALVLYAGQRKEVSFRFINTSSADDLIEIVTMKLVGKLTENERRHLVSWNDDHIVKALPLKQGESFDLSVEFFGISDFLGAKKKVKSQPSHYRSVSVSGTSTPANLLGSPSHESRETKKNLLNTAWNNFISDFQSAKNKTVVEPVIETSDEPQMRIIEVMFEIEYSGGNGLVSGFCRKCAIALNVEIIPSAVITKWDVLPAETSSHCYLVFDVMNTTNQEMKLEYSEKKSILIESKETRRFPVPVERCPLLNENSPSYIEDDSSPVKIDLKKKCRDHLVERVNLLWTLGSGDEEGEASIRWIPWTEAMFDSILMSSIQWTVLVNGESIRPEVEFNFTVGQPVHLEILINNCCAKILKNLQLTVHCYQDFQNDTRNYRLDMRRSVIGSDRIHIDKISPKESHRHQCAFLFYFKGSYKIEIQCCSIDNQLMEPPKIGKTINTDRRQSNSIWKCSPIIELCIT